MHKYASAAAAGPQHMPIAMCYRVYLLCKCIDSSSSRLSLCDALPLGNRRREDLQLETSRENLWLAIHLLLSSALLQQILSRLE